MVNERGRVALRLALNDLRAILARRVAGLAEQIAIDPARAPEILAADADQAAAEFKAAFERRSTALAPERRLKAVP